MREEPDYRRFEATCCKCSREFHYYNSVQLRHNEEICRECEEGKTPAYFKRFQYLQQKILNHQANREEVEEYTRLSKEFIDEASNIPGR